VAEVVKPIRQRRALGMANEIKATSNVSSAIDMGTMLNCVQRRRRRRRGTMSRRWTLSHQCFSQKQRSQDCSSAHHSKFRWELL
jgi:hypothetical protein